MRKGDVTPISEIVEKFFAKHSVTPDGYALRVFFSEFIGNKLAKYADLVKIHQDTVVISVKSAVVKTEIMFLRRKIVKVLNEFLGKEIVKKIRVIEDRG